MKQLFLILFVFTSLFVNAQVKTQNIQNIGNVPFLDIANLARNPEFRNRVAVAMYIKAGETLIDSTQSPKAQEFASRIVVEGDNDYYISIFSRAVITTGANKDTPDALLYQGVSVLWPDILKAWLYATGYYPANLPQPAPNPDGGF
jgi:hypothetical protein